MSSLFILIPLSLALAGLANEPLIALGPEFGTEQELSRRIMRAEEYY